MFVHDVIRKNDFPGVVSMFKQNVDPNLVRYANASTPENNNSSSSIEKTYSPINPVTAATSTTEIGDLNGKTVVTPPMAAKTAEEDINAVVDGETPLIVAARFNRLEVMALLLKAPEIKIDLCDLNGWYSLLIQYALISSSALFVESLPLLLLNDSITSHHRSPLFHASFFGHEDAVMMLLRAGANRFSNDIVGRTAITVAAAEGKMLISALIEADPFTVHIHDMCEQGRLLMVTALLKQVLQILARNSVTFMLTFFIMNRNARRTIRIKGRANISKRL